MREIVQSERGMPKLKFLDLSQTRAYRVGGALSVALASGKLPSLKTLGFHSFRFDETGVGDLGEAVRAWRWPPGFTKIDFTLEQTDVNLDELIRAIGESEIGLALFVHRLNLPGGRLSEEALASLAANGGGRRGASSRN